MGRGNDSYHMELIVRGQLVCVCTYVCGRVSGSRTRVGGGGGGSGGQGRAGIICPAAAVVVVVVEPNGNC